jgi:hypothetical protein
LILIPHYCFSRIVVKEPQLNSLISRRKFKGTRLEAVVRNISPSTGSSPLRPLFSTQIISRAQKASSPSDFRIGVTQFMHTLDAGWEGASLGGYFIGGRFVIVFVRTRAALSEIGF